MEGGLQISDKTAICQISDIKIIKKEAGLAEENESESELVADRKFMKFIFPKIVRSMFF